MKKVKIKLQDGRTYSIDATKVAENRAKHYADDPDSSYESEYKYTLENEDELTDWLFNNMNWYELNPILESSFLPELSDAEVEESEVVDV